MRRHNKSQFISHPATGARVAANERNFCCSPEALALRRGSRVFTSTFATDFDLTSLRLMVILFFMVGLYEAKLYTSVRQQTAVLIVIHPGPRKSVKQQIRKNLH